MANAFPPSGLYQPEYEHDNCGVGFIVDIEGNPSHGLVDDALTLLERLKHRGALGADPTTGDGAGILVQIPHSFFVEQSQSLDFSLPDAGCYGIGVVFLPENKDARRKCGQLLETAIIEEDQRILGWREVPTNRDHVGKEAGLVQPVIRQVFIEKSHPEMSQAEFERKLYAIHKQATNGSLFNDFYIASLSSQTLTYKGMLHATQLRHFFTDLSDPSFQSAIALVHSRFSTNTFPSWKLAHPFRYLAHNGEINTLRGNINWMQARQGNLKSPHFPHMKKLFPIITPHGSDSASLDNVLEFLVLSGYPLAHAMMMLIPEFQTRNPYMTAEHRAFCEYHEQLMEAWGGPALIVFTDGVQIGATLDRIGLRPARYVVTTTNRVILASETGVLDIPPETILQKGSLRPGKMLLIDTKQRRVIGDEELKRLVSSEHPYQFWLDRYMLSLEQIPHSKDVQHIPEGQILYCQKIFGYTQEEVQHLLLPMLVDGAEAMGSMGNDAPLAVLSERPQLLFHYFKQLFAQVTNPPIDSIREELVMSLVTHLGRQFNILDPKPDHVRQIRLEHPVLTNEELAQIRGLSIPSFRSITLATTFAVEKGPSGLAEALNELCHQALEAVNADYSLLILSDRGVGKSKAPIPALLAVSAIHHHLMREGRRADVGIVVETGEAREVAHLALLIGYGAGAINPYVLLESIPAFISEGLLPASITAEKALKNYLKATRKGLLKIFSKMGISTIQSYRGAQIFEAIGLHEDVVRQHFTGTPSRISGVGLDIVAQEALIRHQQAFEIKGDELFLEEGGDYFWRRRGEFHQINPITVQALQKASKSNDLKDYKAFSNLINHPEKPLANLRDLLTFETSNPIPLDEVEPAKEIVKRFATGAMSFGSISREAHETLAIAMNRIGAKSNSGEGGEDPNRFERRPNGDLASSQIKQVASARFGVTIDYLGHCREIQIKVSQGAKPGEGGQLPGHKVTEEIAKVRHSVPGVTLISPPPHHDIYSIEDLAQLIFDLKNANPEARISVKLVAEAGVGTIAAGVAKAHADVIVIAGHDGGTGASPLTSIKHAGVPWELGLSEAHQTLLINGLRGRVRLQTDGQLKTGRDVVMAALLGAEEFVFATAPLITIGCIMMRKCHLNTCPVGVATQDPILRKKFTGQPEHVINYFFFIAEEIREIMSQLGIYQFDQLVGRTEFLKQKKDISHWKAKFLDLSLLLHQPNVKRQTARYCVESQEHGLEQQIDYQLIAQAHQALEEQLPVVIEHSIQNLNRTVGTLLSHQIAKRYGATGLPEDTILCQFTGSAGQSFGAFGAPGLTLKLEGDANDYVGKGLSGAKIIIYPSRNTTFDPSTNIIMGNTVLYGATSGMLFANGMAGERFAVRNSGAIAVIEGVGAHGCEYMTGGRVIVLGPVGQNFGAGMSGGIAYLYNQHPQLEIFCNMELIEIERIYSDSEEKWLREWIQRHYDHTQSPKAQKILDHWEESLTQFVRVIPTEYRAALEATQKLTSPFEGPVL